LLSKAQRSLLLQVSNTMSKLWSCQCLFQISYSPIFEWFFYHCECLDPIEEKKIHAVAVTAVFTPLHLEPETGVGVCYPWWKRNDILVGHKVQLWFSMTERERDDQIHDQIQWKASYEFSVRFIFPWNIL